MSSMLTLKPTTHHTRTANLENNGKRMNFPSKIGLFSGKDHLARPSPHKAEWNTQGDGGRAGSVCSNVYTCRTSVLLQVLHAHGEGSVVTPGSALANPTAGVPSGDLGGQRAMTSCVTRSPSTCDLMGAGTLTHTRGCLWFE